MSGCSQTNIPTIQITPDPCNGEQFSSKCVFHQPQIFYLNLPENTSLQSIITALASKTQQQENSLVYLSQNLQQQINQLEEDTAPKYKVYTALLTQSGGDNEIEVTFGMTLEIGVTYYILSNGGDFDLTIFGAPNSQVGTYFVCTTEGTCPDGVFFTYNTGAPVVTVLENTIGDIWLSYQTDGIYYVNSNGLFIENKTFFLLQNTSDNTPNIVSVIMFKGNNNILTIRTLQSGSGYENNWLNNTPIEIRVYN